MMTREMLEMMTVKELRNYVKDNNLEIAKAYELKKAELIEAIIAATESEEVVEDVTSTEEIIRREEECLNYEEDACTGFSPDMFAEAVELENSRTDYGVSPEEEVRILDSIVAESHSDKSADDYLYEETKKNSKPIIKKLRVKIKYTCPICSHSAKNPYDFCYNCGLHFNHDSERYDEIHNDPEKNCSNRPAEQVTFSRRHIHCPTCDAKIWKGDNNCSYCGQPLLGNDVSLYEKKSNKYKK